MSFIGIKIYKISRRLKLKVKLYNTKYKLCLCQSATPITINTQSQLPSTLQFSYLDKEIAVALEMLPNSVSVDFTLYKKSNEKP